MSTIFEKGITIIIPTYNRCEFIRRSLDSVITDLNSVKIKSEIIVIDDGSTDKTFEEIRGLDITYHRLEGNMGANYARHFAAQKAKYSWLAFHDSDDLWLTGKINSFNESSKNADFIFSSIIQCKGRSRINIFPKFNYSEVGNLEYMQKLILSKNLISTQTLMLRKSTYNKIGGFDIEMSRFQDWELAIRLIFHSKGVFINEPHSIAFESTNSITRNFGAGIIARKMIWIKHKKLFLNYPVSLLIFFFDYFIRRILSSVR